MKRSILKHRINYFDITLRDGLQSMKNILPLEEKIKLADFIFNTYRPSAMEVGSIVSPKVLPQMKDSIEVFKYCKQQNFCTDLYMLTPNKYSLDIAKAVGVKNFSFISSVSESFQKKNTKKNLDETKKELFKMFKSLDHTHKAKLYISCINECPIDGIISMDKILEELIYYIYNFDNINEICLSDTCGTLTWYELNNILYELKGFVHFSKLSLHLHNSKSNDELKEIISKSKILGIKKFDVCAIQNMGGCSVTIDKKLPSNIHYKDIDEEYDFFKKYIELTYSN